MEEMETTTININEMFLDILSNQNTKNWIIAITL